MVSVKSGNSWRLSSEASRPLTSKSKGIFDDEQDSSDEEQEVALSGSHRQGKKTKVCFINVICAGEIAC
jgi:hypothetical protein